jgi:chromosome segregation ATPase
MTSEERCGISPQPDDTCPLINETIAEIEKGQDILKYLRKHVTDTELVKSIEEVEDILGDLVYDPKYVTPKKYLEGIRGRVTEVRKWGQEWKDHAKKLESQIEDDRNIIPSYKNEIQELKEEISRLQRVEEENEALKEKNEDLEIKTYDQGRELAEANLELSSLRMDCKSLQEMVDRMPTF